MSEHDPLLADSAGQPWAGRHFEPNPSPDDDGSAPPALLEAIAGFRSGDADEVAVLEAFRASRLLIPLLAELGEAGVTAGGKRIDKSQELSIVTVSGPDGRTVLPVFSSVTAMGAWNPLARPVPAAGPRVALAAASEGTDLVVLDPTSETEFALRRPALWAIARQQDWVPSYRSAEIAAEFAASVADEPAVTALVLTAGDPDARLRGPELRVELTLIPGLEGPQLDGLLSRLSTRWAQSALIADRVDSLEVALRSS
ncbi:MAG TPA: SseB family protein [Terrimesophilobacter sp.]|nr:SseB family protein [Terrimesophilobacter sp.]